MAPTAYVVDAHHEPEPVSCPTGQVRSAESVAVSYLDLAPGAKVTSPMTYERPDPSAAVTVICYPSGGASLATLDGHVWCGSSRLTGWHSGDNVEGHARYFLTVAAALQFARSCGWVGE